jgi:hypothetical protein
MDVSAVTGQVTLLPESSGEVLVDVVNTEDVIDALDVDLDGIPGASVRIDSATPTLFPGERRRLTLRVELPSQVPAGRHRAELVVLGVATGLRRSVDLAVDVPPQPALAAGAHPAIRRAWHRVDFPVTVANRGNTPLHVLVRDLDVPDTVTVEFEPAEFDVPAWSSGICRARVTGKRRLTGGDQDHVVDLSVTARSTTPGRPLLESEIGQDTRVTFRQRPALSPGVLLAGALVTVAVLWLVGGVFGLRMFVRLVDPGADPAESFFPSATAPAHPDAAITVSGRMVSAVDGSPVAAVTVLACSRETAPTPTPTPTPTPAAACTEKTASSSTVSDGNGHFWIPNLFPGPYQLKLTGKGLKARTAPVRWFESSCSLNESISAPRGVLSVAVVYPVVAGDVAPVTVTVHQATPSPTEGDPSPSPSSAPSATGSTTPVLAPAPPCTESGTGSTSTNGGAGPSPDVSADPSATPVAVESAWPTLVTAADGTEERTAIVMLKQLPAPARYDLTIDAGAGLTLIVSEVHLNADQKHPVINVTLHPSASASPSTP